MLPWLFPLLLIPVVGFWAWLWLSPRRRRSLRYRLEAPGTEGTVEPIDPAGPELLPVAILCPGRDEADHLPGLLPDLCEQDHPDYRVIFIDDGSRDATERITEELAARYGRLEVVRNDQPPPAGWTGKCRAVHLGMQRLAEIEAREGRRYPFVCFTDADIRWDRTCLARALALEAATGADVVGILPHLHFGSALERLAMSAMVLAIGVILPLERAMDARCERTVVSGAFILARRSLYDAIGGHEAVRDRIIEDIGIGEAMKAAGGRVRLTTTTSLVTCRMYESPADLWEGLTKNAYAGLGYRPLFALGFILATLVLNVAPPLYFAAAAAWWALGGGLPAALATAAAGAILLLQARVVWGAMKVVELPGRYLASLPMSSALYLGIIVASIWRHYRAGNTWKGRRYRAGQVQGL